MDIFVQELSKDLFASELSLPIVCFRVFLAILFGGIIGFEREKNNRPAGFRTHILVCIGAAIVSMIEDQLRINLMSQSTSTGVNLALGRLGAQVISGIGFLGAGSIMKDKGETIGGMTTAAGIWATGCVGLCIGWGFHNIAIVAIFFMLIVMVSFKKIESKLIKKSRLINFEIKYEFEEDLTDVMLSCYEVFREKSIRIAKIDKDLENHLIIFTVSMKGRNNISDVIVSLSANKKVEYVRDI
ncbi:MgtC/SapB family protein [Fusobacterium russii]|uniref:MgtC/SapB family protein n=1 Tax=Fusobacterium russii TaxID=854 RepID=UPI00039B5D5B|nr:MgtC/SapB family protein [Fusobacterium russii]